MARIFCLGIGYLFGNLLFAEIAARLKTRKSAQTIGTGNPGTANIASQLGIRWGAVTLLGDVGKTAAACFLCRALFWGQLGNLAILYAGLGATVGHNYPFWNQFRGGKGVAVTCAFLVFFSPVWGLAACTAGLLAALATGYLYLGALAVPALFTLPAFWIYGTEAGALAIAALLLMLVRAWPELRRIKAGTAKKTNLLRWLRKKAEK